jgi:hypothetical protein
MNRLSSLFVMCLFLAPACDKNDDGRDEREQTQKTDDKSEPAAAAPRDDGSPAELTKRMEATMSAVSSRDADAVQTAILGMAMTPEDATRWFQKTFGPELGAKLAKDWEAEVFANLPKLVRPFKEAGAEGRTEVKVIKISSATDENATGLQKAAMAAMKAPVALYTVKLVKPGSTSGSSLWSFAYVDGSYVFLGEMAGVKS